MRFSSLLVAAFLLVSAILLAQHSAVAGASSSAGSASSGASHSAAVSTSSSSSSVSHSSSSSPSHVAHASGGAPHPTLSTKSAPTSPASTAKHSSRKKEVFAPFSAILSRSRCRLRRRNSSVHVGKSPARFVRRQGLTVDAVVETHVCQPGQYWNGLACGVQYLPNEDCRALAARLAQQEQRMRSLVGAQQQACSSDPDSAECGNLRTQSAGESVLHEQLRRQYEQCLLHARSYAFRSSFHAGDPWSRSCSTSSLAGELAFAGRSEGFPREASLPSSPVRTQWTVSRTSNRLQCSPPEMTASNGSRTALEDSDHGNDGNS